MIRSGHLCLPNLHEEAVSVQPPCFWSFSSFRLALGCMIPDTKSHCEKEMLEALDAVVHVSCVSSADWGDHPGSAIRAGVKRPPTWTSSRMSRRYGWAVKTVRREDALPLADDWHHEDELGIHLSPPMSITDSSGPVKTGHATEPARVRRCCICKARGRFDQGLVDRKVIHSDTAN